MTRVSLCVPTRNRAAALDRVLATLIDQINRHPRRDDFELCVSDNASDDDTPAVIRGRLGQSDVAVRHARQVRNLGFACNFAASAQLASGECFALFADDDEPEPGALDLLLAGADRVSAGCPLVMFDTLPGGDAVVRKLARPSGETVIDGSADLLRRLGIFHASFVSNLLFHRETALRRLDPESLKSRYPHTALALTLLRDAPAVFLPGRLVRVTLPPDTGEQPLLTSVDMARVMTEYALGDPRCVGLAPGVYRFLLRMLPTAVYLARTGVCRGNSANPFADLRPGNLAGCYRRARLYQFLALALWAAARCLPVWVLGAALRRVSRHPR